MKTEVLYVEKTNVDDEFYEFDIVSRVGDKIVWTLIDEETNTRIDNTYEAIEGACPIGDYNVTWAETWLIKLFETGPVEHNVTEYRDIDFIKEIFKPFTEKREIRAAL